MNRSAIENPDQGESEQRAVNREVLGDDTSDSERELARATAELELVDRVRNLGGAQSPSGSETDHHPAVMGARGPSRE